MERTQVVFEVPAREHGVIVRLINAANFGPAVLDRFVAPPMPGLEQFPSSPTFSFLLEHVSWRKLVWEFGIRKGYLNYSPKIVEYIPTAKYNIQVKENVADILERHGIDLKENQGNNTEANRYSAASSIKQLTFSCFGLQPLALGSHW